MYKISVSVASLMLVSLLAGCAAVNQPVSVKEAFWTQSDRTIGVAISKLPEAQAHKIGQQGLLDMAINEGMAGEISKYLKKVDVTVYGQARGEFAKRLTARGLKVTEVNKAIDVVTLADFMTDDKSHAYATKDYRPLKKELGVDRLLMLVVQAVGTQRSYYGFIPTSAPIAMLSARGEIVDLTTNEVLWRQNTMNTVGVDDPWDQPPYFPNVDVAVKKVLISARRSMFDSLFQGEITPNEIDKNKKETLAALDMAALSTKPVQPNPENTGIAQGDKSDVYPRKLAGADLIALFQGPREFEANWDQGRRFTLKIMPDGKIVRNCPSCNVESGYGQVTVKGDEGRVCMQWTVVTYPSGGCFTAFSVGKDAFALHAELDSAIVNYKIKE